MNTNTNQNKFRALQSAFDRMLGRAEMSRKVGLHQRAFIQLLAANRIWRWLAKQPNI